AVAHPGYILSSVSMYNDHLVTCRSRMGSSVRVASLEHATRIPIPSWRDSDEKLQTIDELGQRLSGGCTRQAPQDAEFLWSFADVGTRVLVL
ncbi:MAG: L,D-transpeptidase, partial [Actinomycetota bacterium]|nr:L,D-transpeptidase [Actinomycetota bacterium]